MANNASLPANGKDGGQMSHTYNVLYCQPIGLKKLNSNAWINRNIIFGQAPLKEKRNNGLYVPFAALPCFL